MAVPEHVEKALQDKNDYRQKSKIASTSWSGVIATLNEWCGPFLDVIDDKGRRRSHTQGQATAVVQLLH